MTLTLLGNLLVQSQHFLLEGNRANLRIISSGDSCICLLLLRAVRGVVEEEDPGFCNMMRMMRMMLLTYSF